jgi:RNA polymerase sigma factor (TIGR02999 family)
VQFFAVASRAIRRILVDHARRRGRDKRGAGAPHVPLTEAHPVPGLAPDLDLVALDEALTRLKTEHEIKCSVVEMKFFGGLTSDEIAVALNISRRSVERHWEFARAWLYRHLNEADS